MGSLHGLLRFDGASLMPPQSQYRKPGMGLLPPGKIQVLLKSKSQPQTLWLGTVEQGLCRFNTATGFATDYRFEPGHPNALGGDAVAGIAEGMDGTLWVGTDNFTLNKLPPGGDDFEHFTPPPPPGEHFENSDWLGEIVQDTKDENFLWVGSKFGAYHFDKRSGKFQLFPIQKTEGFWYIPQVLQLLMDDDGTLWAGGFRTGLLRLNQTSGRWEAWKRWKNAPELYNSNTIYEILPLGADRLLISVTREGLWWFDKKKEELGWLPETRAVSGMYEAPAGRAGASRFLVSTSTGLMLMTAEPPIFPRMSFQQINPSVTKNNWQRSYLLSPGKDTLYMGTMHGDGLLIQDLNLNQISALSYHKNERPSDTDVFFDELCLDENGKLWMGTGEGLLFLNKNARDKTGRNMGWRIEPFRPAGADSLVFKNKHIQALAASEGWLWAGSKNDGLYRIHLIDHKIEHFQGGENGLPDNYIRKLYVGKNGKILVGSDHGISWFNTGSGVFSNIPEIPGPVTDMEEDSTGRLWLATLGNGLLQFDPSQRVGKQCVTFRNDGSLGADVIFDLKIAQDCRVWLHTQSGLAIFDPESSLFVNYDARDDVPSKYGSLEELPNGTMVSAANLGYHLLPPGLGKTPAAQTPKPYLKSLEVLNGTKSWTSPFSLANIELEHDENQLAFEMGAVWLDANPVVYYEYRLEGFDPGWIFAGSRSFVSYNSLPPGKYRFTFRAGSRPGLWSPPPVGLEVVIRPAFYQTLWFKIVVLLALAAGLWGIYHLRMSRVRREERMQAAFERRLAEVRHDALRAQMNPHFLSNCLNAIQWFIIKNRPKESLNYLTKFSRLVRSVLDQSQRQRISLAEEIKTLRFYLDMESIRFENQFETHFDIDGRLDRERVQVPPMLLQPLVENAIRHGLLPAGRPGILTISIAGNGDALTCTVEDNGIGRAASAELKDKAFDASPSQGLKLASERLSMMNGVTGLIFHDLFDENGAASGTKVVLTLPLEK